MKVDYFSDTHFEFTEHRKPLPKTDGGDVLILAGDITTAAMFREKRTDKDARSHFKYMKTFKENVLNKYKHVFYVMGNHEHYNSIFNNTLPELKAGFARLGVTNVSFFDNNFTVLDDVVFIGSTLWCDFENGNNLSMYRCEKGMNDFRLIGSMDVKDMNYFSRYDSRTITAEFILSEFNKSKEYIDQIAALFHDKKIVVFTHHGPTYQSLNSEHSGNGLDGAYCSDISELILNRPQIKYWVSGHCHISKEYEVGECKVLQNCRGYYMEPSYNKFTIKSFEV